MTKVFEDSVVVDEHDNVIGQMQMPRAYAEGRILRVSIVILRNSQGEILLQKRGLKVLAPNLWTVSASGHVDAGETYETTALRELEEEMGVVGVSLREIDHYFTESKGDNWVARRYNKIFVGDYSGEVNITDFDEVSDYQWMSVQKITEQDSRQSDYFTPDMMSVVDRYVKNTT